MAARWRLAVICLLLAPLSACALAIGGPSPVISQPPARPTEVTPAPAPPDEPLPATRPSPSLPGVTLPPDRRFVGVYDFERVDDRAAFDVEHAYVNWERPQEIEQAIGLAREHGRAPLITVEPFTTASGDPARLLADTVAGANDDLIRANALAVKDHAPQVVLVRFAHEMELIGNYPWSQPDCALYIKAYQHYHDQFAALGVDNIRWVWSPAGNEQAACYYPGDGYVDYVGLTILGNEGWDRRFGEPTGRSFASLFAEKERRVAGFGKPIIIAELGVATGPELTGAERDAYQAVWLTEAVRTFERYPNLAGVVYFNALNPPNMWMGDRPDWRIDPRRLLEILSAR